MPEAYPAGLRELDFVEAYWASVLKKPSAVADSALRGLVLAGQAERAMLAGLIAEQLAEACRRLAAVWVALADRRYPVARILAAPLPGVDAWRGLAQDAGSLSPEQILRHLSLDDSALDAATRLRGLDVLADLEPYVAAAEAGSPMFLVPSNGSRVPEVGCLAGHGEASQAVEVYLDERSAAGLADLASEVTTVSRSFLGAYLAARRGAGWRP